MNEWAQIIIASGTALALILFGIASVIRALDPYAEDHKTPVDRFQRPQG